MIRKRRWSASFDTVSVAGIGTLPVPSVRTAEDIRSVLASRNCRVSGPVYFMYRDVCRTAADRRWLSSHDLRYDITVIPPADLCSEFVKTKGHFHPKNPSGTGYPEIYEVLSGEAHFLLQTCDCSDVRVIAARRGNIVIIPPGYGHVTINPSLEKTLCMANIVSCRFRSDYNPYESMHGAAFYEMITGEFVRNPAYLKHPDLVRVDAGRHVLCDGWPAGPLYELIARRDGRLLFLNYPERTGLFG